VATTIRVAENTSCASLREKSRASQALVLTAELTQHQEAMLEVIVA
jgi:hypothetical protein